ncbi:hypothetical protein [Saccharopolyspora sp. NPDC002686]|uniref:hypothetical protein n=1 Tax=Saccharopolyspora sp. NPDC002686 TaxID=3154541 RepID=UPI00332BA64A
MKLRFRDSETQAEVIIGPRRGLFRICLRRPAPGSASGAGELRLLLVADLLRRVAEDIHGMQVQTAVVADDVPEDWDGVLDALWIPAPAGYARSLDDSAGVLGGPADVVLEHTPHDGSPASAPSPPQHRPPALRVGPVFTETSQAGSAAEIVAALATAGSDPLALRIALLQDRHDQPLSLTPARLDQAADVLDRWRRLVAGWADHRSAPMPARIVEQAYGALDDHFDVGAVIEILHGLTDDPTVQPGAKFETFVHFDRILALELVRYLARPPA